MAWIPALWSPLNGVTVVGQPAAAAASGEPNHRPRWNMCTGADAGLLAASGNAPPGWTTGAAVLPGATMNVSLLNRPA